MGGWQQSGTLRPLASSDYIPSRKPRRCLCWNVHIVDNNFWAILAPEECCSTLEKVSFMSERALLRRSLLHDLRPVLRLLRRNPCCSPASNQGTKGGIWISDYGNLLMKKN